MIEEKEKRKNSETMPRDSNRTAAYVLIGIGLLFLLVNVINISWGRLWPLVLVALGVYLLFGRNSVGSTAKTGYFSTPLDGTSSASIKLNLSVGEALVNATTDRDSLLDAELTYVGEVSLEVEGDTEKTITLRQTGGSGLQWLNPNHWFNHEQYDWRVSLSPEVPLSLDVQGGVGKARLDLRRLQLEDLRLHGGVGEVEAELPASIEGYAARVQGGLGKITLDIPPQTSTTLDIQGGVGEVVVSTPVGAALRVEAHGGIGDVKLPGRLQRVAGGNSEFELGKSGVWQTPDFDSAPVRIALRYTGGVGELKVR